MPAEVVEKTAQYGALQEQLKTLQDEAKIAEATLSALRQESDEARKQREAYRKAMHAELHKENGVLRKQLLEVKEHLARAKRQRDANESDMNLYKNQNMEKMDHSREVKVLAESRQVSFLAFQIGYKGLPL